MYGPPAPGGVIFFGTDAWDAPASFPRVRSKEGIRVHPRKFAAISVQTCSNSPRRIRILREMPPPAQVDRMTAPAPTFREYDVAARSTDVFGRVLCSAREHHFIVDGPVQNGCPGEEITPAEVFLSAVAACGTELIHVIAREQNVPLARVSVRIHGVVDRARQPRPGVTT